ncbi:MAG TPA: hypothetical protein VK476_01940 [Flavobacterium sp.]|nr:hypothetical protein [Flavobacterium sp.]
MKNITYCFCFLLLSMLSFAQLPGSTMAKYRAAKTTEKAHDVLRDYFGAATSADSATIARLIKTGKWFRSENDTQGGDYVDLQLAYVFSYQGDYNTTLSLAFPILERFQKRHDEYGIMRANHAIALAYSQAKNYESSFMYMKKTIAIAERISPTSFLETAYNDIAVDYSVVKKPELGLVYAQKSINIAKANNNRYTLSAALGTMGENYMAAGEFDLALPFLRKSMAYFMELGDNVEKYAMAYGYNDFGQAFLGLKQQDSARYYTHKAIRISKKFGFKDQLLRSYECMYTSFELTHTQDSVNAYFRLAMAAKDDMFSIEKMRSLETMKFRKQIRQQELEAKLAEAEYERQQNIQFIFIGTFIITFFILFLMLSRTVIVNEKWISFLAILALLLVFEFVNLLIHPFLGNLTHHSPIWMLLCMVALASLLIPMHHKLEHFIKHRLTEKNKAIRIAAAKKTLEELH